MDPEALIFPCLPVQICQTVLSQRKTPATVERVCSNRNVVCLLSHATLSAVFALYFLTLFTSSSPSSAWLSTQFDPQSCATKRTASHKRKDFSQAASNERKDDPCGLLGPRKCACDRSVADSVTPKPQLHRREKKRNFNDGATRRTARDDCSRKYPDVKLRPIQDHGHGSVSPAFLCTCTVQRCVMEFTAVRRNKSCAERFVRCLPTTTQISSRREEF
ncbi:UNVERIFIED_CONTAM: hypothetical protein HHA_309025 [Hammondia hammondi]|eukprot:XP_008888116.1 hypothetical protein HHA_309025 [Hammondia hammondi]